MKMQYLNQPFTLVWIFSLISNVDQFVFLDRVQFDKRAGNKEIIYQLKVKKTFNNSS